MDIRDRIIQFVDYKGISFNFFEKNIGASKSYISNTKNISAKVVSNILRIYPELSPEWVLTGEGSMLKKENAVKSNFPVKSEDKGVPYYNVDFVGGFDLVINDQTQYRSIL